MATPPNLYFPRINLFVEFFDDTIDNDDMQINDEELTSVDQVMKPHTHREPSVHCYN